MRVAVRLPAKLPSSAANSLLGKARERRRDVEARMRSLHGYDLVRRNCATEALALLDQVKALEPSTSVTRLRAAAFIPFVSAQVVEREWPGTRSTPLPAFRERRLDAMSRRDGPLRTRLRESNTLSAAAYDPALADSTFLLFADVAPLRPLAGGVNLVVGAAASLWGGLTFGSDGGALAVSGLRGMLFSLPELGFVRIRRGSYDFVDRRLVELPDGW